VRSLQLSRADASRHRVYGIEGYLDSRESTVDLNFLRYNVPFSFTASSREESAVCRKISRVTIAEQPSAPSFIRFNARSTTLRDATILEIVTPEREREREKQFLCQAFSEFARNMQDDRSRRRTSDRQCLRSRFEQLLLPVEYFQYRCRRVFPRRSRALKSSYPRKSPDASPAMLRAVKYERYEHRADACMHRSGRAMHRGRPRARCISQS